MTEKDTFTYVKLCSQFNPTAGLVCDEKAGHQGAHRASVFWLGEDEDTEVWIANQPSDESEMNHDDV